MDVVASVAAATTVAASAEDAAMVAASAEDAAEVEVVLDLSVILRQIILILIEHN